MSKKDIKPVKITGLKDNSDISLSKSKKDEEVKVKTEVKTSPELKKEKNMEANATKVVNAINNALTKINAMAAPFVNNIKDPSAGEAIKACQDLDAILSDVKTALRNN